MSYLFEAPLLWFQRFYTGWITLRSQLVTPIRLMGRRVIELFDALISGNDLEITSRLTLAKRPGYLPYFAGALNGPLLNTFTWKSASIGTFQIFDTTVDIEYIQSGAVSPTVVFTKPQGTIGNKSYFFGVGNYLFFSGLGFAGKWDGGVPAGQGQTNWGIAGITSGGGAGRCTQGANNGRGNTVWTNPGNVTSTVNYATVVLVAQTISNSQQDFASAFGFNTSGTIVGIQVTLDYQFSSLNGQPFIEVYLAKNGQQTLGNKFINASDTNPHTATLGGPSDLWFTSWTNNDVNSANFGPLISAGFNVNSSGNVTFSIRNVNVTVFVAGAVTATPTGVGAMSAVNGYSYVVAYGNSFSGETSNASPPSVNTGAFSSKASVQIGLTASTDSQVNQIHVYRTTDSGGGAVFFELPNSPFSNSTGNVNDTATDSQLQQSSIAEINFGNTRPPSGLVAMEWFAGRMWGAVGNLLYASTGPDSVCGLQQSNWNPAYVYTLPSQIVRLVAIPNGMLVQTIDDCKIVRGLTTAQFAVLDFARDIAVRNWNAVDSDGTNIYCFTTDRALLSLGPAGFNDIGREIADQLQSVNPTTAYVTIHRFGLDNILFVLDTVNGIMFPYALSQQAWCLPAILNLGATPNACGSMEISAGTWAFIIGAGTNLGQRDLNTFTDLGRPYAPQVVIGTIQVADPGTLAKEDLLFLETTTAGSLPSNVAVLPNDAGIDLTANIAPAGNQVIGNFQSLTKNNVINPQNDPPTLSVQPKNYRSLRYNWSATSVPANIKHLQVLIQWPAEPYKNELLGFGLCGKQMGDSPQAGQLPQLQGH